tara:strand:+ start:7 stop:453 length:447 start_codon:yes stop_codon:yes gene_type:complete
MKKDNNDTWLAFFKRTLKISGIILICIIVIIGLLIGWFLFKEKDTLDNKGITYLNCEDHFLSFTDYKINSSWDGLENKWNVSLDTTKINKSVVEAEFDFKDGKGIYIIDRINATIELKNLTTKESLAKRKCIKIKKKDLPKSEVTPKF